MSEERRLQLSRPWVGEDEIDAVARVLRGGWLTQGPEVERLENRLADRLGAAHALTVNSGTAALQAAIGALTLPAGSEVLVPDFTFPATANTVLLAGLVPRIVDIDPATFAMVPQRAAEAIGERTAAIMPVHQFGLMADMDALCDLARQHRLRVIEDAACALGARSPAGESGRIGDVGCFSFHPRKTITTGEGGLVVTDDAGIAARVRRLRNHGIELGPDGATFVEAGYNLRMPDICAAIGNIQIGRLDEAIDRVNALARRYVAELAGLAWLTPPTIPAGYRHTFQTFAVLLDEGVDRAALMAWLKDHHIESSIGAHALHRLPYLTAYHAPGGYPGGDRAGDGCLCLPLHPAMEAADVDRVVAAITAWAAQG